MLHEIFYWLFNMSMVATVTGAFVMLLRMIKRIPRRIAVVFWVIPFLRMCIPIGLSSRYSLMTLISRFTTKTVTVYKPSEDISFSMMNSIMGAKEYFPITYKINILEDVFKVASVIWLVMFSVIAISLSIMYFTTMREVKNAVRGADNVAYSDKIAVPAVYGIFKPKIVLPILYRDKNIKFVLLHEMAHIKRADNLFRIIAFAVTAVHWFNPFAWIFLKMFLNDIELACDEKVISRLNANEVKEYAYSLLNGKTMGKAFVSSFGGASIRVRIEKIMSFKKMTYISVIGSGALLISVFWVLMTNAK